jgi:hypothetical protein
MRPLRKSVPFIVRPAQAAAVCGLIAPWVCCPLVSPSGDLASEAPVAKRGDDQAAASVGGICLGMAGRAECDQAVEIEVRAPLGALDDVVDLEGVPAATGLAPPAGAPEHRPADRRSKRLVLAPVP